jgi:hypothetical protein
MQLQIGQIYWTNLSQPGGPVCLIQIAPHWTDRFELVALIEFVKDHPYGYEKGTRGWYPVSDLRELTPDEAAIYQSPE